MVSSESPAVSRGASTSTRNNNGRRTTELLTPGQSLLKLNKEEAQYGSSSSLSPPSPTEGQDSGIRKLATLHDSHTLVPASTNSSPVTNSTSENRFNDLETPQTPIIPQDSETQEKSEQKSSVGTQDVPDENSPLEASGTLSDSMNSHLRHSWSDLVNHVEDVEDTNKVPQGKPELNLISSEDYFKTEFIPLVNSIIKAVETGDGWGTEDPGVGKDTVTETACHDLPHNSHDEGNTVSQAAEEQQKSPQEEYDAIQEAVHLDPTAAIPASEGGEQGDKGTQPRASTPDQQHLVNELPVTDSSEQLVSDHGSNKSLTSSKVGNGIYPNTASSSQNNMHIGFPKRAWYVTKAVGRKHKGKLEVAGALALTALIVGGIVYAFKKIRRRIPISNPFVSTVDPKKCFVLVDFEKAHRSQAMGKVVSIQEVFANNAYRILTVRYAEKPALRSSRGKELFNWIKYRSSFAKLLTQREENLSFPESCMAGMHSGYQVIEQLGHVQYLMVDLDLNPGPLTVPREVMENDRIDDLLSDYEKDPIWKLYEDCIMHITINKPFSGSLVVQIEPARERVTFQNPELHDLISLLPRECEWSEPWKLRVVYKSGGIIPLDLLLMMSAADTLVPETVPLKRFSSSAKSS
ncbi:uncharacterized protein LOC34619351 [Cyclospora cayetanensis]|uniref:Uncharacterized protein LOC34619351 n=1 Tax=Cyclospora cayetanensis TaxID=88456 RepID=A0A6P6RVL6_9EIME|nr:uncharacterized protein LOC34619351 [Cyclospora cayetanensis]